MSETIPHPTRDPDADSGNDRRSGYARPMPDLSEAADELLAVVAYLTADDGPVLTMSRTEELSPWHRRVLDGMLERLEVVDHYLRGRLAFFVAGREHGYGEFEEESALAAAALDACRCAARVVDDLLDGRLPMESEFAALALTVDRIYPALGDVRGRGR